MKLTVLYSSVPEILKVGEKVSLIHNGCRVEVFNNKLLKKVLDFKHYEIHFHMEDEKTEIEIDGLVPFQDTDLLKSAKILVG